MNTKFIPEYLDISKYENGAEIVDPRPKAVPVGFTAPLTLEQQVARLLAKSKAMEAMEKMQDETEADAMDFDIEDPELDEEQSFYQHAFASGVYDPKMDPLEQNLPQVNTADKETQTTTTNDAPNDASDQKPSSLT